MLGGSWVVLGGVIGNNYRKLQLEPILGDLYPRTEN